MTKTLISKLKTILFQRNSRTDFALILGKVSRSSTSLQWPIMISVKSKVYYFHESQRYQGVIILFLCHFSVSIKKSHIYLWRCYKRQRRLDPGMDTPLWFFQVWNQKEYQKMVLISFVHLKKINNFCFLRKGVSRILSLPCPLEY